MEKGRVNEETKNFAEEIKNNLIERFSYEESIEVIGFTIQNMAHHLMCELKDNEERAKAMSLHLENLYGISENIKNTEP